MGGKMNFYYETKVNEEKNEEGKILCTYSIRKNIGKKEEKKQNFRTKFTGKTTTDPINILDAGSTLLKVGNVLCLEYFDKHGKQQRVKVVKILQQSLHN
jgi:hypothetical protein